MALDLFKTHKSEYVTPREPVVVDVGPARYLTLEGRGAPGGDEFTAKVGALYALAYTMKMTYKAAGRGDYTVPKLEGQWWVDGDPQQWQTVPRDEWRWRLLMRIPEFIGEEELSDAREKVIAKKSIAEAADAVLVDLTEGRCVQVLHAGRYSDEPATVERMHAFVREHGLTPHGQHHEIYLSDARRVAPEKLKTILRMPVT